MKNLNIYKIIPLALMAFVLMNCKAKKDDPNPGTLTGNVKFYFDNQAGLTYDSLTKLILDNNTDSTSALPGNGTYVNAYGNQLSVNKLRYWISHIILTKADGTSYEEANSYHLVDVSDGTLKENFTVTGVPLGDYTKISFIIGVDSAANHDLTKKAGDLSETIGMSWTWNTGYIFLKMEGRYNKNGQFKPFIYHVGLDKNRKTFNSDLPEAVEVVEGELSSIHIKANVLSAFGLTNVSGSTIIDLNKLNFSMGDSTNAVIANNYSGMFKIDHIHGTHH